MSRKRTLTFLVLFIGSVGLAVGLFAAPTFNLTALSRPNGSSEPAISIGSDGTMAITALSWLTNGTNLWSGSFGSTPAFQAVIDAELQRPAKTIFGGGDADVDIGTTGRLHVTSLIFLVNPPFTAFSLGVSAISCPMAGGQVTLAGCTKQILDFAGADRPWITSDGPHVYISYHDAGNSTLIHMQRSDDDGLTWKKVGDPIVGQGRATGSATFNNDQGPVVADTFSHNVYDIYAAGEPGIQKATSATFNNIFVSRSSDGGKSWQATQVFHAPLFTALNNVFPTLAVDPTNGNLYAGWSDAHNVFLSVSLDQGQTWSPAVQVNTAPAPTAVFPWIAAYNGTVDIVYYGTTAASKDDPAANWHVYFAQPAGPGFTQTEVNATPNHVGVICTNGVACAPGTRNLLDLFEVAIDPLNGLAGIIYTDDTLTKDSSGNPLPQVVLARQQ